MLRAHQILTFSLNLPNKECPFRFTIIYRTEIITTMSSQTLPIAFILLLTASSCTNKNPVVTLAVTTDVHGMIYPYDFITGYPSDHSLSHIYNYASQKRNRQDTLFCLLDNGDFLQGQPSVYFYNYIDTTEQHLAARVMNYMGYVAGTVGNHDIEAGPAVYNRVRDEFNFPWLAANAVSSETGEPVFEPYTILEAGRKKIAVLGLITPGIPKWLPESLWPGMEFRDMVETAGVWIPRIRELENPDLIVGLFHSGTDDTYGGNIDPYLNENAVVLVAEQVPGFDVIFAGHDHRTSIMWIKNNMGDSVLVVDPGSHARFTGEVTISFAGNGKKEMNAVNIPMNRYSPSGEFLEEFAPDFDKIAQYLEDTITWLNREMSGLDALFGPSSMMSLIHNVQMDLSGADLSFTSPLSLSAKLEKGPLLVSDMFKLYRFENMLYALELSGKEIDLFLEFAAGLWFNTMNGPEDHLLLFSEESPGRLANPYYNFSSAAGIDYIIDVRRPVGDRVTIYGFSNGDYFSESEMYRVAVNSYRANGGGGHLTRGIGIPPEKLSNRVVWSTEKDLRYFIMQKLKENENYTPEIINNWHCIPEKWVETAVVNDHKYFQ